MKKLMALAALVFAASLCAAQEQVPEEQAKEIAKTLVKHAADVKAPLKFEADETKPYGLKDGDYGAIVIPAKSLTADVIAKADKEPVAVAQFWMKGLTPHVSGKALPNEKLHQVKVKHGNEETTVTLYTIGVRKGEKGLEAVVYAKDKEPVVVVPLEKIDNKQTNPIEFEAKKGDESATLTFHRAGKYKFQFDITRQQN